MRGARGPSLGESVPRRVVGLDAIGTSPFHDGVQSFVADQDRYQRQMLLPEIGASGQERLCEARMILIGCGALGCVSADLLARAGAGTLRLVDRDLVELTNLQRQSLFTEADARARKPKAIAARDRLAQVNSEIALDARIADLRSGNAERLVLEMPGGPAQVIVDGTDNFEVRYLLNDLAVRHGIPLVYGGAVGVRGVVMPVVPGRGQCLRCLSPDPPAPGSLPTCDTAGVLGAITTLVGAQQAAIAIRLIAGSTPPEPALLEFDAWTGASRALQLSDPDPQCPCCALGHFDFLEGEAESESTFLCGQDAVQVMPTRVHELDLARLHRSLDSHGRFRVDEWMCRGTLHAEQGETTNDLELTVFADGRAIVRGTRDPTRARAIYARYVGA